MPPEKLATYLGPEPVRAAMAVRSNRDATDRAVANRCKCGHYVVAHLRVIPVGPAGSGSSRLDPSGPCGVCGAAVCARLTPTGPGSNP